MRPTVVLLALALHSSASAATRLAIHPLRSEDVTAEAMQQLDAALRIELGRVRNLEIVETGAARPCEASTRCLAEFGKAARADEVLWGEVRGMPDSFSVTLRLVDTGSGKEIAATSESYNRDVEEMVWAARGQVARLKAPERWAGQLVVDVPAASKVTIDGRTTEAAKPQVLRPGLHEVRIASGDGTLQDWIEVRFDHLATAEPVQGSRKLAVTYRRSTVPEPAAGGLSDSRALAPESGRTTLGGAVAIGAGAALVASGAFFLFRSRSLDSDLARMRGPDGAIPAAQAAAAQAKNDQIASARIAAAALLGTGAALSIGGAIYLLWAPAPRGGQLVATGAF